MIKINELKSGVFVTHVYAGDYQLVHITEMRLWGLFQLRSKLLWCPLRKSVKDIFEGNEDEFVVKEEN